MRAEMGRPFSLEDPVLFRFALIRINEDQKVWFQKYHHLIIDSMGRRLLHVEPQHAIARSDLANLWPALNAVTPEEILDRERRYTNSKDYEADRAYWLAALAQWPGPLLETNRENTERGKSGRGARILFSLKRADFVRLRQRQAPWDHRSFARLLHLPTLLSHACMIALT